MPIVGNIPEIVMPIITGQLRTAVAAFGAYLATYGVTVSGEAQDQLVGAGLVAASLILSGVQKWWAERKKRRAEVYAAKATAEATMKAGTPTPVTVVVTPGNLPNEAVRISATELAAAPLSPPVDVKPSPAPKAA
jgi:hypothetical protein